MKQSEHLGADEPTESRSNKGSPTGAGKAAAGGVAVGGAALGGLAAKLGGAGLAIAGTAVAISPVVVIGVGVAAGATVGGLVAWGGKKAIDSWSARAGSVDEGADDE